MAAIGYELSDQSDEDEPEWGWGAVKNWWNPSCNKGCRKAEKGLLHAFVDSDLYQYESRQIPIAYDAEPISVKQKRLQRSQTFSFLPRRNGASTQCNKNDTSTKHHSKSQSTILHNADNYQKMKNVPKSSTTNTTKNDTDKTLTKQEVIHTLTFQIKQNKLQTVINKARTNHNDIDNDQETPQNVANDQENKEIHETPANEIEDEIKNDGQAIEGKSLSRFFVRTSGQNGSGDMESLQRQIEEYSNIILSKQSQQQNSSNIVSQPSIVPIVLSHGYGCAGGIFIPSISTIYETLLSNLTVQESPIIHVLDWLGGGMSSRPEFQCETTEEAEDFFVESLEAWRKTMGINKMILGAHSLGGYAVANYAMRYPQYVEHLLLLSPCGVPVRPPDAYKALDDYSWKVRTMFKTLGKLWDSGWTPHDVIRMIGPKGKAMCQKIVQRRLFRLSDDDPLKELLAEYLYHVIAQRGSGEYALSKILQPGAWAHKPLAQSIGALKKYQKNVVGYDIENVEDEEEDEDEKKGKYDGNEESESIDVDGVLNQDMKIDFIYGTTDWMTSAHAVKLKQNGVIKCDVYITPDCGHQLILENSKGFGELLGAIIAKGQILAQAQ